MDPSVLTVALSPIELTELRINNPFRLAYSHLYSDERAARSADLSSGWEVVDVLFQTSETNQLFDDIQDAKIGDTSIIDFIRYDSVSMWQFLPSYIWPQFFHVVQIIDTLLQIVERTKPQKMIALHGNDRFEQHWIGSVQEVCKKCNIPVVFVEHATATKEHPVRTILKKTVRLFGYHSMLPYDLKDAVFHWRLRRASRNGNASQTVGRNQNLSDEKPLIFATVARNWRPVPGDASGKKYDEQFYPLLPSLRALGYERFIGLDCPYGDRVVPLQTLIERRQSPESGFVWQSFYAYGRTMARRRSRLDAKKTFGRQWDVLRNDTNFLNTFTYKGVPLLPALYNDLKNAFERLLPICAEMRYTARVLLQEERPKAVVATYETGPYQRALFIEAKRLGIPTVGLMHGMIFRNHYDYMHRRVSPTLNRDSAFTIGDRMCVWGEFWKRNLTEYGHYPQDSVVVTGNWRLAGLEQKAVFIERAKELRREICRNEGDRLVLILTAGERGEVFVENAVEALSVSSQNKLVVKLHPNDEREDVFYLLANMKSTYAFRKIDELTTGFLAADVVVSQASTTIAEAVHFDRPVIWANLFEVKGWEDYLKHNAVLYTTTVEELPDLVEKALYDSETVEGLRQARKRMNSDYFLETENPAYTVAKAIDDLVRTHRA